jgi:hypothetical protein
MINKTNGEVKVNDTVLGPKFDKEDFLNSNLYHDVLRIKDRPNFTYFYLGPQTIGDDLLIIALYFSPIGNLRMIKLSITSDKVPPSWANWSEEAEMNNKMQNDEWLLKVIGKPPYKYSWGEISSSYDPRSASSMITIRYHES